MPTPRKDPKDLAINNRPQCSAVNADGHRCGAISRQTEKVCWMHSPHRQKKLIDPKILDRRKQLRHSIPANLRIAASHLEGTRAWMQAASDAIRGFKELERINYRGKLRRVKAPRLSIASFMANPGRANNRAP